ncbi:MAG: Replication factor C (RF-C) subunit [Phylliscum demangeonii]|nr:MAG: Replication factor C (RF-C) subunit [Phylliscum demangeonii]
MDRKSFYTLSKAVLRDHRQRCPSCCPQSSLIRGAYRRNFVTTPGLRNATAAALMDARMATFKTKNTSTLYYILSVILGTTAFSYGSVPMYKMICQQTGWGGQPIKVTGHSTNLSRLQPVTDARRLRITFNGSVSDVLPWKFTPQQREVRVLPGESALAFYTATNKGKDDLIGVATYSVSPGQVAPYFSKIQCFCFEEQRLNAGETVDMPVFFFIDPEFLKDPQMKGIDTITLSYTFFTGIQSANHLHRQAQSGDFPHLLVYGPSGAGKKTRIIATLRELYGPGVEKIKIDARVFQTSTNRKLEFNVVSSVYHLEITPSDVGNYDRVVVQDLLKEVAQTQQVDMAARQRFKVVVINEADHLTRDAQAALRRTMEKYSPSLRLILLANTTSNIIAPIRSRTLLVRVAAPTEAEIVDVLRKVGAKENWAEVDGLNRRIAQESGRNLRRALLMFETVHALNEKVTDKTPIPPPDWESLIAQVADEILAEHSPARILQVRAKLYDLLTHCIPPTTVLKVLTFKLIPKIDDALKAEVLKWSAFYEHRIKIGTKVIFHLEAFVAKVMRILESYLLGMDI